MRKNRKIQNKPQLTRSRNPSYHMTKQEKAQLELQECSMESQFQELFVRQKRPDQKEEQSNLSQNNQSIRSSGNCAYSTQAHSRQIVFNKLKNVTSRYMSGVSQNGGKMAPTVVEIQSKNPKQKICGMIKKIQINPSLLGQYQDFEQKKCNDSLKVYLSKRKIRNRNFAKMDNPHYERIHTSREIQNLTINGFPRPQSSSRTQRSQNNYYSFNDTIMSQKGRSSSLDKGVRSQELNQSKLKGDKVKLRPEFLKYLKKIKEKEEKQVGAKYSHSRLYTTAY